MVFADNDQVRVKLKTEVLNSQILINKVAYEKPFLKKGNNQMVQQIQGNQNKQQLKKQISFKNKNHYIQPSKN